MLREGNRMAFLVSKLHIYLATDSGQATVKRKENIWFSAMHLHDKGIIKDNPTYRCMPYVSV